MARPREFSEADVLRQARDVFWVGGAGTSISDVCKATGLVSGSIYKADGSKVGLLHATLDDYLTRGLTAITAALDSPDDPRAGLEVWLDLMAEQFGGDSDYPAGCYMVQTAVGLTDGHDPWVQARLDTHERALLDAVTHAVARTRTTPAPADAETVAHLLMTVVNGVAVAARTGITTARARELLREALDRLV